MTARRAAGDGAVTRTALALPPLTIGSLFSGIGGLELGLEWAGLGPVLWQCEIDPFCRAVLAKHWPNVTRFEDVTRPREWPRVDLICGGFPCQDVSSAGAKRGLGGERSSLWWYFARVVEQVRPSWVVVENVASGKKLWLPHVRHQLHVLGYRTRAFQISAHDVGAPHLRRRVFVVAYAHGEQLRAGEDGTPRNADRVSKPAQSVNGEVAGMRGVAGGASAWAAPPEFRRVAHGVPHRVDRLRALGNAVVPQCAEVIGRVIQEMRHGREAFDDALDMSTSAKRA